MRDINTGFNNLFKDLKSLAKKELKVGVFHDAGTNENGESIAEYAIYNEYGTEDGRIPARSFLNSTFDRNKKYYQEKMNSILDDIIDGKEVDATTAIGKVGEQIRKDVVTTISSNVTPANKPSTVAKKKSKRTLIDTGALRSSIRYEVN